MCIHPKTGTTTHGNETYPYLLTKGHPQIRTPKSQLEITIYKDPIKTPRRWAKRQSIMRKMRFEENTIRDLGTLNRGQSMLLNLFIKGYTHVNLAVYSADIELTVYGDNLGDLEVADTIIRNQMADGDTIKNDVIQGEEREFATLQWRGHLNETEFE